MFNQDTFDKYSDTIVEIMEAVNLELINKITKQLGKGKSLSDDEWIFLMQSQFGPLQDKISRTIEKSVTAQTEEIKNIQKRAVKQGITDTDKQLSPVLGAIGTPESFIAVNEKLLQTVGQQLNDNIRNGNLTMLNQAGRDYLNIINETIAKKELGAITRQEALSQVVSRWSEKGVPALKDSLGRRWQVDSYVNMVVRTNSLQIAKATQERRAVEYGYDLILTSQHSDQSPEHAPFANKIYSLTGKNPDYPPFSVATSQGFMTRPNCRHTYNFWFEGEKPKSLTSDEAAYRDSQKQRAIERDIRKYKRQAQGLKNIGEDATQANAKVRAKQQEIRTFLNKTGRTRRRDREQI